MSGVRYVVEWRVPKLTGDEIYQQEYDTRAEADSNALDIGGYEGVVMIGVREKQTQVTAWERLGKKG